jgi:hypothetical protein
MAADLTLPISCAVCGAAITLIMKNWDTRPPGTERDAVLVDQTYACPICLRQHQIRLPGSISLVAPGHASGSGRECLTRPTDGSQRQKPRRAAY